MSQRPRPLWQGTWPLWCHSEVRNKKETLKETKWREAELFFCCFELPAFSFLTPDGTPDRVLHGPPAENQRRCWSCGAPRELCVSLHIFKHQTFALKMKTDVILSAAVNLFLFGGLVFPWCTTWSIPWFPADLCSWRSVKLFIGNVCLFILNMNGWRSTASIKHFYVFQTVSLVSVGNKVHLQVCEK